jgi:hypothetical protein
VVENGLSLCSLHHKAFDLGAIAISDDHKVLVSHDFRAAGNGPLPAGQWCTPRGASSGRASDPCGLCGLAPQGGVPRAASSVRARDRELRTLVSHRLAASLRHGMLCHAAMRIWGRITVASFGVTPTARHTDRDPFFNLGLQPTHRVRGELATGRKLPPTLQTPKCRPRQSCARADLSTSEEARWGTPSPRWMLRCVRGIIVDARALLTSADATRWRTTVATLCASRQAIRSRYPDPVDSLIFHQFVSLEDARQKIEAWRLDYNQKRPHGALGYLDTERVCHSPSGNTHCRKSRFSLARSCSLTGPTSGLKTTVIPRGLQPPDQERTRPEELGEERETLTRVEPRRAALTHALHPLASKRMD